MEVVVDPGVPPEDARLIRDSGQVLVRMRRGWVPEPPPRAGVAQSKGVAVAVTAVAVLLIALGLMSRGIGLLLLAFVGVPVLLVAFIRNDLTDEDEEAVLAREVYEQLRWYEGRYVLTDDLDEASRRLLARAQRAIATVNESSVNAEGLLDGVRNAVMLPAQEWEIARLLAKLSALRTRHRETVTGAVTPEVAAVAEPLARALDSSEEAVVARVEALERYAANVTEAERAFRAHQQVEELRGRIHQYEELVAETGADAFAVPEIARLAEDADQLEQALRRSLSSAHEAFRHLEPGERS
ncbi:MULTISPECIES: hypothetical protein [Nonomuraea]|uniref:Uncharacterized protein n=2 Tax=Nonomuraea TaxID=83681 RepID=A0ABW1BPJ1_9ACTN|nr:MULTISPECIES: hypothetical protein [Nonomuraea]MDA0645631.1 hypothetical protein [Nonomuraea ferruginea]TXK41214.1 hypothetical protein FR742_18005 [Nonomuraea sp. C10]